MLFRLRWSWSICFYAFRLISISVCCLRLYLLLSLAHLITSFCIFLIQIHLYDFSGFLSDRSNHSFSMWKWLKCNNTRCIFYNSFLYFSFVCLVLLFHACHHSLGIANDQANSFNRSFFDPEHWSIIRWTSSVVLFSSILAHHHLVLHFRLFCLVCARFFLLFACVFSFS